MHKDEIQCTILVRDPDQLCASLRAARRAGPGSLVVNADGMILSVTAGADEPIVQLMAAAAKHNAAIYRERPELLRSYYVRRETRPRSRGTRFQWLLAQSAEGLSWQQRRAATLAREKAEREAMGGAA